MRNLELFSGAGGLAAGFSLAGFEHCAMVEHQKDACETLRYNYPQTSIFEGDVRNFDFNTLSDVDVITSGPPCQPFSLGGKHQGYQDTRDMFPAAVQAIRTLAPKAFVLENVKGLLRSNFKPYLDYILLQLTYPEVEIIKNEPWQSHYTRLLALTPHTYQGLGYSVSYQLMNAADYGVPQIRERVFIVGIRTDLACQWQFPTPTHDVDALKWIQYVETDYWDRLSTPVPESIKAQIHMVGTRLKRKYGLFAPPLKPWVTLREAISDLPCPESSPHYHPDHYFRAGAKIYQGHTGSYIDLPSKTIKAGNHGVPGGENMIRWETGDVRYLTILEAKRLQTFSDDYHISGVWSEAMRQLGNAVPVKLAQILANALMACLQTATPLLRRGRPPEPLACANVSSISNQN